jgi:hypothetical protein
MSNALPLSAAIVTAIALAACGADTNAPPEQLGYTVRDSAGVAIVENTEPEWGDTDGWRISPEPRLTIGVMDGPQEYMFFRARVARQLDDGRLLVTNMGTSEVRFYDAQGTFINASGSEGEGPGEFMSLGFTWVTDTDSVYLYDNRLRRFSVLDHHGVFARTFMVGRDTGEFAHPDGVFGDGTVLASVDEEDQGGYAELGTVRGRSRYDRFNAEGDSITSLASLPGSELYKGTHPDGSGFTTSSNHAVRPFAFAGGATWFYGAGDGFEFQERGLDGRLLRVIRVDKDRRPMPRRVRDEHEESLREMNAQAAALWGAIPLPDSLPVHERLEQDKAGNLWVEGYTVQEEDPFWSVFARDGHWLGDLQPPSGLRITEIGDDYLMGVWADTLGVEQVRVYEIVKGGH